MCGPSRSTRESIRKTANKRECSGCERGPLPQRRPPDRRVHPQQKPQTAPDLRHRLLSRPSSKRKTVLAPVPLLRLQLAASAPNRLQSITRIAPEPTSVSQEPPKDETYRDYGVNPWIATLKDHLSTFALDVDTASYSVMRRYVNEGTLPPFASVRAEEYINYFTQDYPIPLREDTFGVYVDGAMSPFQNDGTYLLRIGVQGYTVQESEPQAGQSGVGDRRIWLDGGGRAAGSGEEFARLFNQ